MDGSDASRAETIRRIRQHTTISSPLLCPELRLSLATPETDLWRATEDEARALGFVDPYWAFCWPGGQALARWIFDSPERFAGLRVLDFGAGSAIAGIAAALRGADVLACDIDPLATVAADINAELNGVRLRTTTAPHIGKNEAWDLVLVADVTYEAALTRQVLGWLSELARGGSRILVADPGRGYLDTEAVEQLATYKTAADNDAHGNHLIETHIYELPARRANDLAVEADRV